MATIKEAVLERKEGEKALFAPGCPLLGGELQLEGFRESAEEELSAEVRESMLEEAVKLAGEADTVVLALGEHRLQSGEATSNAAIQIPKVQMELFRKVCEVNDQVVVVLFSGRPLDIREISGRAKAVLLVWMPGTEGARAIMDVLSGDYSPSGKLPMSFPYCVGQVPVHYNEYSTGRPHVEGKDKDRFRSRYLDIPNAPLYPFGYGLSYTKFEISPVESDRESITKEEKLHVSIKIKNVGDVPGTETLQLYIRDIAASVVRPVKELKGFQKISLEPGQEEKVTFEIDDSMLRFLTENDRWESESGEFEAFVGADSSTVNGVRFKLKIE